MRYRVMMSVAVDARSENEAQTFALKLKELLKSPLVRMAVTNEGIKLAGSDGSPTVHEPQYEGIP